MPIVAYSFMPAVVKGLVAQGGPLRLAFVEATVQRLIELLHEGMIDCVIALLDSARVPSERLADLKVAPLYQDGLAVACANGHPLLAQAPVTHAELLTQEWVLAPQATRTRQVVESSFLGMGLLPPTPLVESGSFHANLALVAQTRMLTVVPSSSVQGYSGAGKVQTLSLVHPFAPSAMNFVTHRDVWETPALQTLYQAMALHAKDWPLNEAVNQL
jgi:DNA-binding transcriptional LysR family regulator